MHSRSRKKKWASGASGPTLASHLVLPLRLPIQEREEKQPTNTYKKTSTNRECVCVGLHEKHRRQEVHQLQPIITLCALAEACVLIMSGRALFLPRFFNTACLLLCTYVHDVSCAQSCRPWIVWWRARRMTRNNGAINSHLCFPRWPCHRRLRGSEVRRAKCQQHSATRCTSSHSADLKSVASIWGKAENAHKPAAPPILLQCTLLCPTFIMWRLFNILSSIK